MTSVSRFDVIEHEYDLGCTLRNILPLDIRWHASKFEKADVW
jgi:hypothetical protein